MDERRPRLDIFLLSLSALAVLGVSFFNARNGAALIMCALVFSGLVFARLVGFSNRALVPVAIGLVVILWVLWVNPPSISDRKTSAIAHASGGLLIGWAVAEYLRGRIEWPLWAIGAVAIVAGLTVLWELGEYLGDRYLDTALLASKRDSAIDITFGTFGGAVGVLIAAMVPARFWR